MDRELLNYTQNRELSWLRFDQRVLEEARDKSVPLLERMKFVAIFTSNLDEFFMIRVGSLYDMVQTDDRHRDSRSGMTPQEQLDAIATVYTAIPRVAADGIYGPATAAAVREFQSIFGLPQTGVVDFATWYKISHIYVGVSGIGELYGA